MSICMGYELLYNGRRLSFGLNDVFYVDCR